MLRCSSLCSNFLFFFFFVSLARVSRNTWLRADLRRAKGVGGDSCVQTLAGNAAASETGDIITFIQEASTGISSCHLPSVAAMWKCRRVTGNNTLRYDLYGERNIILKNPRCWSLGITCELFNWNFDWLG